VEKNRHSSRGKHLETLYHLYSEEFRGKKMENELGSQRRKISHRVSEKGGILAEGGAESGKKTQRGVGTEGK